MENKTFTVPSIGCNGCVRTIENELAELSGVQSVKGDVASKQVSISWDSPASWESIKAKLVEIEYAPAEA